MADTIFLLVEGPHDAEFIARLLAGRNMIQRTILSEIPFNFRKLFPSDYPATEDTPLIERHPVPAFYQNGDKWLILLVGGGSKGPVTLGTALRRARIAGFLPDSIGVIVDQDEDSSPVIARDRFTKDFKYEEDLPQALDFSISPGTVVEGSPRIGFYVFPDNDGTGALEDIMLECAEENYKFLKKCAFDFRNIVLSDKSLMTELRKEYGAKDGQKHISKCKKAWISSMGAILCPAAAIQNSIRKNCWLQGDALHLPKVAALIKFLDALIE